MKHILALLVLSGCIIAPPSVYDDGDLSEFEVTDSVQLTAADFADGSTLILELYSETSQMVTVDYQYDLQMVIGQETPAGAEPSSPLLCAGAMSETFGALQIADAYGFGTYTSVGGQDANINGGSLESDVVSDGRTEALAVGPTNPQLIYLGLNEAAYWANDGVSSWSLQVEGDNPLHYRTFQVGEMDCGIRAKHYDSGTWSDAGYYTVAQDVQKSVETVHESLLFFLISADVQYDATLSGTDGPFAQFQHFDPPTTRMQSFSDFVPPGEYTIDVRDLEGSNTVWWTLAAFAFMPMPTIEALTQA